MTSVKIETLGCSKNLVDSEIILGSLVHAGMHLVDDCTNAEIIIVNTCGFIAPAKEESINTILEMAMYKENGKCKKLVVTGCMVGKYGVELAKEIPEIDLLAESSDVTKIVDALGLRETSANNALLRTETTNMQHTRYLKISEGCNNNCTYCTIPQLKGNYKSRSMEEIVKEAEFLVQSGAKEIVLVAQDTTRYGVDLSGKRMLAKLVKALVKIEGLEWLRMLYCYPSEFTPELINIIANEEKVCNYLDIPLQHVSDDILKRMGRRSDKKQIVSLLETLRKEIPDITIRSTFIVGFPGETEGEFNELLSFLKSAKLDWVGAFTYWPEADTAAAEFQDQVSQREKEKRLDILMEMQRHITADKNSQLIGKKIDVIIEGISSDYPEYKVGRSQRQAPEVDGIVYVTTSVEPGEIISVRITGVWGDYDLLGEDAGEFS
ncbi:30S ribosomal protein S12 methylthiotransferase RimO [Metallumcola ferriviriculae]|uniref:Ribosomal protein uS12 methylthiotransferase RimO n=1 Tax=Metallumcola ferriviriculae TaxID=3039180 RepID=A0AAU0UPV6_9FIRM|nr:30S ribosomal protein S12 methylthiotransferase RimO [Desulfitibacteraceae bacterium MK1]